MKKLLILLGILSVILLACGNTDVPKIPTTLTEYYQGIDFSCTTDADCVVKDVHNCCGYFPQCVNKDTITHPALVEGLCANEEILSACGYEEVNSCGCVKERCVDNPK